MVEERQSGLTVTYKCERNPIMKFRSQPKYKFLLKIIFA